MTLAAGIIRDSRLVVEAMTVPDGVADAIENGVLVTCGDGRTFPATDTAGVNRRPPDHRGTATAHSTVARADSGLYALGYDDDP